MPMVNYKCEEHGLVERWFRSSEIPDTVPCEVEGCQSSSCPKTNEVQLVLRRPPSCGFPPIYVDQDEAGEFSFPGSADEPVSEGYQRMEIRTYHQYEKMRNKWESQEKEKVVARIKEERSIRDVQKKEQRERIDAELNRRGIHASRLRDMIREWADKRAEARDRQRLSGSPGCHNRMLDFNHSNQRIVQFEK